ncbi:MAG: hypothetical protein UY61_C0059G0004 [Candidatus Adlerbacteria bacterium GW2011_GWC1_50_9]|uniref:Uncharacterized protein n=1 Tax=Candidatus Adlerbacteria bacterium GW2011_GWC1_50_9 TaxID=1618608 RepID=A0A0G1WKK5_9BACT|nr:MAG: hypothetical protein UY61_C0059G0004 [Candidatus Adlerbacteria bacterium GW2011_GWC1_50_9]
MGQSAIDAHTQDHFPGLREIYQIHYFFTRGFSTNVKGTAARSTLLLWLGMFPCPKLWTRMIPVSCTARSREGSPPGTRALRQMLLVRLLPGNAARDHAGIVEGERDEPDDTRDRLEELFHEALLSRVHKHPQLRPRQKLCSPLAHGGHCSCTPSSSAFGAGVLNCLRSTGAAFFEGAAYFRRSSSSHCSMATPSFGAGCGILKGYDS